MEVTKYASKYAAAIAFAALLASSTPARADGPAAAPTEEAMTEARTRYARGVQLAKEGAFEQAQVELERAYQLAPSYKILYNLALTQQELNDFASARISFEKYLESGDREVTAARRAEVEERIAKLKTRVGTLDITSPTAGVEILIDDVPIGRTPLAKPVVVNAGRRKVTAITSGAAPLSKIVVVAGAETVKVDIDVPKPAPPEPKPAAPVAKPKPAPLVVAPAPARSGAPWFGWALTGVGAGALTMGILSLRASSDLSALKKRADPSRAELDKLASRSGTFALVTDVLLGATAVVGGVSLYLTLKSSGSEPAPRAALQLRLTGNGAALGGSF